MIRQHLPEPSNETWVITESGLNQYVQQFQRLDAQVRSRVLEEGQEGKEDNPLSYLYSKQGTIGVISIRGPMLNVDNELTRFYGMSTYPAIQQSILAAVEDPEVDRIVLDIDSPGGTVSGVSSTSDLIYAVDKTVKPVFAASDGYMASGAYWLASSTRRIYADHLANVGSIGVIQVHMDYTQFLEKEGIKATPIRTGKYKALGMPYEPLSEEAEKEMQSKNDGIYRYFVTHVSDARDKSYEYTDKVMGEGRVFMGQEAKEVGLIDKVTSFTGALAEIQSAEVDTQKFPYIINT